MIDRKWIGHALPETTFPVERGRLRFFAKAIGEKDPVYSDPEAARAAGYPDVLAPPTFLFSAELDSGATERLLADLGIPYERLLHGEQGFTWHHPVCAGDTVTVRSRIADVFEKKGGALELVVRASSATNQRGELVAELRTVLVCRN